MPSTFPASHLAHLCRIGRLERQFQQLRVAVDSFASNRGSVQHSGHPSRRHRKGLRYPTSRPEELLPKYDLVFAKARCALEAMATGCAVVLCDFAGLGSMVNPERFPEFVS